VNTDNFGLNGVSQNALTYFSVSKYLTTPNYLWNFPFAFHHCPPGTITVEGGSEIVFSLKPL
jgi:hypothetical protein